MTQKKVRILYVEYPYVCGKKYKFPAENSKMTFKIVFEVKFKTTIIISQTFIYYYKY